MSKRNNVFQEDAYFSDSFLSHGIIDFVGLCLNICSRLDEGIKCRILNLCMQYLINVFVCAGTRCHCLWNTQRNRHKPNIYQTELQVNGC